VLTIRAMSSGEGYAQRHLRQSDYYDQNRTVEGRWCGRGAELLGLKGEVTSGDFEAVRQGLDPQTGEFLRQRHSADRIASNGAEQSKARSLYDMTFSAPKSVSVMAIVGADERLVAAHESAVREALDEAEKYSATRVRLAGLNENRATGNWIVASYTHDTSRQLDPQLHTHAVAANLTCDGTEGRWKALQASGLYERRSYLTEVYRNALAREVRSLGYEIENRHDVRGRDKGFEIAGLSQDLLDKYSQRSAQRDAAILEFTNSRGRAPTDNEVAVLVRETRADKLQEISTERVRNLQQERLSADERQTLREVLNEAQTQSYSPRINRGMHEASLAYSQEHIFERLSVAREHEVLTEALRHGRGNLDLSDLQGSISLERTKGTLIASGDEIATHASLQRERDMIAVVNRGLDRYDRLGKGRDFELSDHLRPEQRCAVEAVLDSRDLAINIRGAAGTGKTATLREIDRGLREAGHEVLAVAPSRSAVDELEKVGFRDAMTVSRLLEHQEPQGVLRGKILIVDEAGMVSGRQMQSLLHLAEDQGARIVFSGDTRQITSVEASDALRILERESELKSVSLTEVQRQTNSLYREAVKTMRHSPEEGFAQLEKLGAIREVSIFDRGQAVADLHREFRAEGRETLVVAGTHTEISQLTDAIRQDRKEHGELGVGHSFDRYVSLQWTRAQKEELSNYQEGQILQFHRDTKLAKRHESLEVVRTGPESLVARKETGEEANISPKQTRAFSVYERQLIEVAPGDSLMLTANRREPELRATNGEMVKVSSLDGGAIRLEDGRTLPANYHEFTHGYVVTAHRSQGKTVDTVIISADAMKKELFYVAASRGRSEIVIVTSDREQLRESVGVSTMRQSAIELARKQLSAHSVGKSEGVDLVTGVNRPAGQQIGEQHSSVPTQVPGPERTPQTPHVSLDRDLGLGVGIGL
jgi:conjugative relaxase-like TrwC/TraI family protein